MNNLPLTLSLVLAVFATTALGFSPSGRIVVQQPSQLKSWHPPQSLTCTALSVTSGDEDDFPPDESTEYSGNVDWDAEWKKVVEKDGKLDGGVERPGKDFYKSEAEIAAIKAANSATKKVSESASNVADAMPDFGSLSGDWKFWIAILALVSVGLSLLSAPADTTSGLSSDSFYV